MLTDAIKDQLNNIIQINLDAAEGYKDAAAAVSDADLQVVFNACSVERQKNANELIAQVNLHGADPETESSLKANLHRTWMTFKADIISNNETTVVDECIRGDEAAMEVYDKAIPGPAFTPAVRALVIEHHTGIKKNLNQLNEWKTLLEKKTIV